jgi:hypothetical protein
VHAHNFKQEAANMRRNLKSHGMTKDGTPRWNAKSEDGQELDKIIDNMILAGTIDENTDYTKVVGDRPQFVSVYSTDTLRNAVKRHAANKGIKLILKGKYFQVYHVSLYKNLITNIFTRLFSTWYGTATAEPRPKEPPPKMGVLGDLLAATFPEDPQLVTPAAARAKTKAPLAPARENLLPRPRPPAQLKDDAKYAGDNDEVMEGPPDSSVKPMYHTPVHNIVEFENIKFKKTLCVTVWLPSGMQKPDAMVQKDGRVLIITGWAHPLVFSSTLFTTDHLERKATEDSLKPYRRTQSDPIKVLCSLDLPVEVVCEVPKVLGKFDNRSGCTIMYIRMKCVSTDEHYRKRDRIQFEVVG